jgi:hypothetical protein
MDPKRTSGTLMTAAGALFLVAGILLRLQQPVWIVLGAVLILLGSLVRRRNPPR